MSSELRLKQDLGEFSQSFHAKQERAGAPPHSCTVKPRIGKTQPVFFFFSRLSQHNKDMGLLRETVERGISDYAGTELTTQTFYF